MLARKLRTDVSAKDSNGHTPLHHAAENGHHQLVSVMIEELRAIPFEGLETHSSPEQT